jgi:(E)-4-hydroxy-3-methylbut-2-enyl-diphosphate synthase
MTTTNTNDTEATINQCIRAIEAGAELVRITAQGVKEASNLKNIKEGLLERGYNTPLVADIHFNPAAAMEAALWVDKVRINPGNYADPRAQFEHQEYSEEEYKAELQKLEEKFLPLLRRCRERGVALRIGVNHGSLSDRIMSRFGDTPEGMVESAMEFLRICRKHQFDAVVVSMKASNTLVMVQANRLLVSRMAAEGLKYPLHLGVTEAGDGEDGRIKSAVGIGALLSDGIGDTIRVSLTEEPELEIPVARKLVDYFNHRISNPPIPGIAHIPYNPYTYTRRKTNAVKGIGGNTPPVVIANLSSNHEIADQDLLEWGWRWDEGKKHWEKQDISADYFYLGESKVKLHGINQLPLIRISQPDKSNHPNEGQQFIAARLNDLNEAFMGNLKRSSNIILILETLNNNGVAEQRAAAIRLMGHGVECPIILARHYNDCDLESFQLKSAADLGALLIDGLGDGVMLTAPNLSDRDICTTAFSILQATRTRISKTEYISCPGCGRTLFNLQETLGRVKKQTSHLRGLKIGVMGCIVNGPGEMADADYGYVGAGPGRITLYKGMQVVKKNIPEADALGELIGLIKSNGDWKEADSAGI